jgi:hypothetical protein
VGNRPLEGRDPYPWLDVTVEKVGDGGRVVRTCLVLGKAVHEPGYLRARVFRAECDQTPVREEGNAEGETAP